MQLHSTLSALATFAILTGSTLAGNFVTDCPPCDGGDKCAGLTASRAWTSTNTDPLPNGGTTLSWLYKRGKSSLTIKEKYSAAFQNSTVNIEKINGPPAYKVMLGLDGDSNKFYLVKESCYVHIQEFQVRSASLSAAKP